MKKGDEFNIPDEEILTCLREQAPEAAMGVDDVRRELGDLVSEPGIGDPTYEFLELLDDALVVDTRRLITLAIHNILAKRRAEQNQRSFKESRNKRKSKPMIRGRKGTAEHQNKKRKEISDDDIDA